MNPRAATAFSLCLWATSALSQAVLGGANIPTQPQRQPAQSIGNEANWYIDWTSGNVFGPKSSGQWPQFPITSLSPTKVIVPIAGIDMSLAINAALQSSSKVQLTCGTYSVDNAIIMPSNTELAGAGTACTYISANTDLSTSIQSASVNNPNAHLVLSNADFVNGNLNLSAHDFSIRFAGAVSGTYFPHQFYKVSGAKLYRLSIDGTGTTNSDGLAFTQSDHYTVEDNSVTNVTNACYDNWQGSSFGDIHHNKCLGNSIVKYGVLINGIGGANIGSPALTTHDFIVSGNIVENVTVNGIAADGLFASPNTGKVEHINILGNIVTGVSQFFGIWLSNGNDLSVNSNHVTNIGNSGIRACSSPLTGVLTNVRINGNIIDNANSSSGANSSIDICGSASANIATSGNTIVGSSQLYSVRIGVGVTSATVDEANLPTGSATGNSTAAIRDDGTNSTVFHKIGGVGYINNAGLNATGTWTPILQFGGATTGIAYDTQTGEYWRTGPLVYACAQIALSSKGSATGNATVSGLPFNATATSTPIQVNFLANTVGLAFPAPYIYVPATGGSSVRMVTDYGLGTPVTNANFANTTFLNFCGTYATP